MPVDTRLFHCRALAIAMAVGGCATNTATAAPAKPEPAPNVVTSAHVAKLRSVGGAEISPDGRHIAFTLRVQRRPFVDDNGPAYSELHVVDANGEVRPFITGKTSVSSVKWTPDGSGISFLAKRGDDEHTCLYVIPIGGGEARRVASAQTNIGDYDWRPDGALIAFIAQKKKDKDLTALEKKGFAQEVVEERFELSRVWLVKPAPWAFGGVDADDAPKAKMLESVEGSASSVSWSPAKVGAGYPLLVAVAPTPAIDDHYMKRRFEVYDTDADKRLVQLATPGKVGATAWSPDGSRVAIVAGIDQHDPSAGRLTIGDAKTGALVTHLADYAGQLQAIAWPTKDRLVYMASEGAFSVVGSIKPDGSGDSKILAGGERVFWSMTVNADGTQAAFVGESPAHPSEVFGFDMGAKAPKRLTDSNPWLAAITKGKQEVITWKARDGLEIEGILMHPIDKPKGPAPLIIAVHGGPESHIRNGWLTSYSYPGQVAAAGGFYVLYPNYRGSTGRGVEYSKMGQGDYAGKEFNDILDAIDHLVKAGLVDPKKVGVTGGSYGGFASAWMATKHTDRFAASVMFVGISDQVSKFGTTDIPNEMFLVHARKWPWKEWAFFRERSPITYVEQARTPILIMHGKNDTRVHPSQSMELFRYLKTIGKVPVRLVMYPGEGHGNRKAASRLDYNLRLMRWMKHYLMGPGGSPPGQALDYAPYEPPKDAQTNGKDDAEK